jgi:hypothetical protein
MNTGTYTKEDRVSGKQILSQRVLNTDLAISKLEDKELLQCLQSFGYSRENILLLHLIPLVQVAWAEGRVTKRERTLILKAAALRGIERGTPNYERLLSWLDFRPSDEFFEKSLMLISTVLHSLPTDVCEDSKIDLLSLCIQVAQVSGGELGFAAGGHRICLEEIALIKRIAAELNQGKKQELIERIRLSEMTGITDSSLLSELQQAGYRSENISILFLVPLVEMAWAEDVVTAREKRLILSAARLRGIRVGSKAYEKLNEILEIKPSKEFFEYSFKAIKEMIGMLPHEMRGLDEEDLLSQCSSIAEASGEPIGFTKYRQRICYQEQALFNEMLMRLRSGYSQHTNGLNRGIDEAA